MYLMYKDERELGYQQINLNSLPLPLLIKDPQSVHLFKESLF